MNPTNIWLLINSMAILFLLVALYVVIRQVGIILSKVGPVGARGTTQGPRLGENIDTLVSPICPNRNRPTLLILGNSSCAICDFIKNSAIGLASHWQQKAAIVIVYDDHDHHQSISLGLGVTQYFDRNLRDKLDVRLLPFAMILNEDRIVLQKGIVNDISNIESLLETLLDQNIKKAS